MLAPFFEFLFHNSMCECGTMTHSNSLVDKSSHTWKHINVGADHYETFGYTSAIT